MPLDAGHPLSDENIFQVLTSQQVIPAPKASEILKRKASLKEKLSKQQKKSLTRTCRRHASRHLLP